jgi:hypothetical protein
MARHAFQRSRTALSLVAVGSVAALTAGVLGMTGAATAAPKYSANLVANPDFEAGTKGWNAQASHTSLSRGAGHESKHSGVVTARANGVRLLLNDSPNVVKDTAKGDHFVASVWVSTSAAKLPVSLRFREVDGGSLVGTAQSTAVAHKGTWTKISGEYRAAGAGHEIAVQVISATAQVRDTLLVDDVDVRVEIKEEAGEKPKPSTSEKPKPSESPTPTPKPSPSKSEEDEPAPAKPVSGPTLFGASVYTGDGDSFETALSKSISRYGSLETVRVFYPGMPADWPGKAGKVKSTIVVSFKADPKQVVSGSLDSFFTKWFADAPRNQDVYWTNFHEPEDQIESGQFTAAQYREAYQRLDRLADKAGNPRLHTTTIWMCFDLKKGSGRDWHDYYPGDDVVDVMGWDCYNRGAQTGAYDSPASLIDALRTASESKGKPWGLGEFASKLAAGDNGTDRAAWLRASANYFREHDALWVNYFDAHGGNVENPEYRLLDSASQAAWRWAVSGS